jgi:hypothetical protein
MLGVLRCHQFNQRLPQCVKATLFAALFFVKCVRTRAAAAAAGCVAGGV